MGGKRQESQLLLAFAAEGRGESPAVAEEGIEPPAVKCEPESPTQTGSLMEEVCQRDNLWQALKRVEANEGASGVDGMTVRLVEQLDGGDAAVRVERQRAEDERLELQRGQRRRLVEERVHRARPRARRDEPRAEGEGLRRRVRVAEGARVRDERHPEVRRRVRPDRPRRGPAGPPLRGSEWSSPTARTCC